MKNKTVLITGATSGLGRASAYAFAGMGANVAIAGRNEQKTQSLKEDIIQKTGNASVGFFLADLEKQADVRKLVDAFKSRHDCLHVLVNNAGAYFAKREETADGYERTFALNHLAPFLLTNLLMDTLKQSAPARIVNVASDAHKMVRTMKWDDLMFKKSWPLLGWNVYCYSKMANMHFTFELARRLKDTGVTANCIHPGFVRSGLAKNNGAFAGIFVSLLMLIAKTPEAAAETVIWAATSEDLKNVSGNYFARKKVISPSRHALDESAGGRLWKVSAEMAGVSFEAI